MIIFVIIIAVGVIGFLMLMYKGVKSAVALSRESVECPACGREIKIVGTRERCYKCGTKLIKHATGQYIKA